MIEDHILNDGPMIPGVDVDYETSAPPRTIVRSVCSVHTLEGKMQANPGDWIITGVKGEKYPCKPDIFELTYEPVGDS